MPDPVIPDRGAADAKTEDAVNDAAFDDAFKEAADVGTKADLSAADDPANVKDEEPVEIPVTPPVTPLADPLPPAAPPTIPATPEPNANLQLPGESDEKFEQRYKTLQGIHKHDRETWETERASLLSDIEAAKKPVTPTPAPDKPSTPPTPAATIAAEAFIDSLTDEQKKQLEEYEQDFDVVSKMEGIKRKVELGKLRKEMMDTMEGWKKDFTSQLDSTRTELTSKIAPAVSLAEETERDSHFNLIRNGYLREDGTTVPGHADFETYRDDGSLLKWIEAKPKYLQPALKHAYEGGTAEDVIDLFSDFKRDNNIPLTTPEPSSDNVVNINPQKQARKEALRSVPSRRGSVNTNVAVSDDYDGAFDEALHKSGG